MAKVMLGDVLHGPLLDFYEKLSGEDGGEWWEAFKKFLRKEITWYLLEQVATATIPAIPTFDVVAHFRVTPEKDRDTAEVVIGYMGDIAARVQVGIEPETAETTLRASKLVKPSAHRQIMDELGGEQAITTTWGQMYEMMRQHGRCQRGILLTNGHANIFYIPDVNGAIWAVYCYWSSGYGYWAIRVCPSMMSADDQVVSR